MDDDPDERALAVGNRHETGTSLKNKTDGQRYVALAEETCAMLDDCWRPSHRGGGRARPKASVCTDSRMFP